MDVPPGDFAHYYISDYVNFSYLEDPYLLHTEQVNASHAIDQETHRSTDGRVLLLFVVSTVLWLSKFKILLFTRSLVILISATECPRSVITFLLL